MKTSEWSFTPFKGLKEAIKCHGCILSDRILPETKTDEEIFADAMADVREIKEFREISPKQPAKVPPLPKQRDDTIEELRRIVRGESKIRISDTGEYIEWTGPSVRKDIAQRLHRGNFSVQDFIDLHGMSLAEAEEALTLFLREAIRKRLFCVKVIHGRGLRSQKGPVLKEALKKLLQGQFRKWVIAYSTAKACDGGLGATYVILKSQTSASPITKGGIKGVKRTADK